VAVRQRRHWRDGYLQNRLLSPGVRVVIDWLAAEFAHRLSLAGQHGPVKT